MNDTAGPPLRPALGAWAGLLLVAEVACETLGARLSWKTKSVSGRPDDEYLSLMTSAPPTPEGRALLDLLDQLESLSERIDPTTGRMRVAGAEADLPWALERESDGGNALAARIRQSLREKYRQPGLPPMLTRPDHAWPSEDEDLRAIAADNQRRIEELVAAATQALGDRGRAVGWVETPNRAFRGRSPLQALNDGEVADVYHVLGRIEHGIFE